MMILVTTSLPSHDILRTPSKISQRRGNEPVNQRSNEEPKKPNSYDKLTPSKSNRGAKEAGERESRTTIAAPSHPKPNRAPSISKQSISLKSHPLPSFIHHCTKKGTKKPCIPPLLLASPRASISRSSSSPPRCSHHRNPSTKQRVSSPPKPTNQKERTKRKGEKEESVH